MKKWIKPLCMGALSAALIFPVMSYAVSKWESVEARVVSPSFHVDGKVIQEDSFFNGKENVPYALNYEGTTYVPVRVLGELMGKRIGWDPATKTIDIESPRPPKSPSALDYEELKDFSSRDIPQEIKKWIESSRGQELTAVKSVGDSNYILIQRGEKPTAGYSVQFTGIYEINNQVIVTAAFRDPQPGMMQAQVITYPSILVKTKKWDDTKRVVFAMDKQAASSADPGIVAGDLDPALNLAVSEDGKVHFAFKVKNQTEHVQNLTFENGLEYDYTIRSEQGQKIAQPTEYGFDQQHEVTLKQGEELSYEGNLPQLRPGKYKAEFYLNDTKWKAQATQEFVVE